MSPSFLPCFYHGLSPFIVDLANKNVFTMEKSQFFLVKSHENTIFCHGLTVAQVAVLQEGMIILLGCAGPT
jgi:hypothetical protein